MSERIEEWRWYPEDPLAGTRSTMDVIVPETRRTQQPFGFARALLDDSLGDDSWAEHARALGGSIAEVAAGGP